MSNIRQNIINHLKLSEKVEEAVTEFFKENKQKDVVQEHFNSVADFQILHNFLEAKINIIKEKNEYLKSKDKFERAIKDMSSLQLSIFDVANKNKIDDEELYKEYRKFDESRNSYKYDRIIDNGVFTFIEEFSLLEQLKSWRTNSSCSCRYCALEHLLNLAYTFASTKGKCPPYWKDRKQADEQWLYEFEMRHSEEISEFLSFCVKDFLFVATSASQHSSSLNIMNILESCTSRERPTNTRANRVAK